MIYFHLSRLNRDLLFDHLNVTLNLTFTTSFSFDRDALRKDADCTFQTNASYEGNCLLQWYLFTSML